MAVTDLTEGLPWWARQGGAPSPGAPTPPGARGGTSWLDYLASMFAPGSASAAEPDINAVLNAGGTPPVNNDIQPGPALQPQGGPAMPARPAGVSATGLPLQPGSLSPGALSQFASAGGGPIGSGGYVPWPSGGGSMSPTAPPPAGQAAPGSPAAPVPGPLAAAPAANRFIGIDRPNADPQNSMRSGPQGTALNLAGLFGGGQPNPNVPSAAAQPVAAQRAAPVPGPLAMGSSKAPGFMGPLQKGSVWPSQMGPMKRGVARARILQPENYG